ncbi:MAG: CvpA family protein, partial [Chitinispirillaceae bacterium]|nr:CvpA family protein [Chitinispirillaceae bacterium]
MHTFDILFIIGSMFFIIVGVRRGLIGEVFRIIALVAGFLVAFLYFSDLSPYLRFASPSIANPVAFSLIYLATAILILLTGWMLKKIIRLTPLGWVDYSFGGAIGLCKAVILFWIVCLSLSAFPASRAKLNMNRSTVYLT